jgi:hypothetical protein
VSGNPTRLAAVWVCGPGAGHPGSAMSAAWSAAVIALGVVAGTAVLRSSLLISTVTGVGMAPGYVPAAPSGRRQLPGRRRGDRHRIVDAHRRRGADNEEEAAS